MGPVISSWIGTGDNQAVLPDALHGILGSDVVQQIAEKTGLPMQQLFQRSRSTYPNSSTA